MFKSFLIIFIASSPVLSFTIRNRTSICRSLYQANETAPACSNNQWQCCDGSCVSKESVCDNLKHCPDGSDEELCETLTSSDSTESNCILPPYPDNGTYSMEGKSKAVPGDAYELAFLNITCNPGFSLNSQRSFAYCIKGLGWLDPIPKCIILSCSLPKQKSVEYRCSTDEGTGECNINVPNGTVAQPVCRKPNYMFPGDLPYMHCIDGVWDYVAMCIPNRKRITTSINNFLQITITTGNHNVRVNTKPGRVDVTLKLGIYNTHNANNTDNKINNTNSTALSEGNTVNTTKVTDDHNSDIDESLWRLGE